VKGKRTRAKTTEDIEEWPCVLLQYLDSSKQPSRQLRICANALSERCHMRVMDPEEIVSRTEVMILPM